MTTIIAEIGINHNGDIEIARKLMDMAKRCGANYVKFQKRTIETVYTETELNKPRESPWGTTTREQKEGLELGFSDYEEIDRHSKLIGIPWTASAWDIESLVFLDYFCLEINKIASPMLTYCDFLEEVAQRKKLTYISTGGVEGYEPIDKAVNIFKYHECPFVLMHCVLEYPCPDERCNLNVIYSLQSLYPGVDIGFSSHSVSPHIAAYAVVRGAVAIEQHITLDRSMYGSDQSASLEEPGLRHLIDECRQAEVSGGDCIKWMTPKEAENAAKLKWFERED